MGRALILLLTYMLANEDDRGHGSEVGDLPGSTRMGGSHAQGGRINAHLRRRRHRRAASWTGEHFGEEAVVRALEQLRHSDAMVMGRRTYEMFSNIWPSRSTTTRRPSTTCRSTSSSTLEAADWNNTTIVREDVASAVRDLKQQPGQDIVLYGHGSVGQTLLEAGLLDGLAVDPPGGRGQRDPVVP